MTKKEMGCLAAYRDRTILDGKWSGTINRSFNEYHPEMLIKANYQQRICEAETESGYTLDLIEAELENRSSQRIIYPKVLSLIRTIRTGVSLSQAADELGYRYDTAYHMLRRLKNEDFVHKYR